VVKPDAVTELPGFDVVCTVGRVVFGQSGDDTPVTAAFRLIGEHDAEGFYSFPRPDGRTCTVNVMHVHE